MSNRTDLIGNLGDTPSMRHVPVAGEDRVVTEFSIYVDRRVPTGKEGPDAFEDRGGFWMNISVWGNEAERVARVLRKGMRVCCIGEIIQDSWEDKETKEERVALRFVAEKVFVDLVRVESITMRQRAEGDEQSQQQS